MKGNDIVTTLELVMGWLNKLALLNILWILFTLFGLIIGGIFPSTAATLGVARKWLMGKKDIKVWKTFRKIYREEFISTNIIGWILSIVGGLLFLNYRLLFESREDISFILPFVFYLVLFLFLIIVTWVFPLNVHNYASIINQIKNAFIIGIARIHITITIMLLLFSFMFFSLEYPVLLIFFTFSVSALVWMWLSLRVFTQVLHGKKDPA
ncbi:YesL family protein [Aquibacillus kalidii]|uniref:YesL family protein n=1 Tax=Aquibacillus kalidii TaxID=2762597 RepID=UPI001644B703|nr:YesL family protein [Aquibacillus kalidii]